MIASAYKSGDGPSDVIPYKYLPKYDERAYDQPTWEARSIGPQIILYQSS